MDRRVSVPTARRSAPAGLSQRVVVRYAVGMLTTTPIHIVELVDGSDKTIAAVLVGRRGKVRAELHTAKLNALRAPNTSWSTEALADYATLAAALDGAPGAPADPDNLDPFTGAFVYREATITNM